MNRFKNIISKSPIPIIPKSTVTPAVQSQNAAEIVNQKKYQRFLKDGPQLMVTKILMVNGPLQNKQIWRLYTRMLKQNSKLQNPQKIDEFKSLTHLKRTIKYMISKDKIKSAGYDRKMKEHKGWQIQTDRALKFVHPEAIQNIQKAISAKDVL